MDIRKSYQGVIALTPTIDNCRGDIYLKDNVIQIWQSIKIGSVLKSSRETWTFPKKEDARQVFEQFNPYKIQKEANHDKSIR